MIQLLVALRVRWGKHIFTQEEISSPQGFIIILGGIILLVFLLRWMAFGKDAKAKFMGLFPSGRITNPDLQYVGTLIALLGILVIMILLLISSITGVGLEQYGR